MTAMDVSFTGPAFSQSVLTLAAVLEVVQMGPFAFTYWFSPSPFWAPGFGKDRANAGIDGAPIAMTANVATKRSLLVPTSSPPVVGPRLDPPPAGSVCEPPLRESYLSIDSAKSAGLSAEDPTASRPMGRDRRGLTLARRAPNPGAALWRSRLATCQDSAMAVTVLIVDDHPIFRSFARDLLESEGFRVIGESEDGQGAIQAAGTLRPDVVLLDVQLGDLSGFEVTERLKADGIHSTVVLVSSRSASDYGDRIQSSGAAGFVPKGELSGDAIRALLEGAA